MSRRGRGSGEVSPPSDQCPRTETHVPSRTSGTALQPDWGHDQSHDTQALTQYIYTWDIHNSLFLRLLVLHSPLKKKMLSSLKQSYKACCMCSCFATKNANFRQISLVYLWIWHSLWSPSYNNSSLKMCRNIKITSQPCSYISTTVSADLASPKRDRRTANSLSWGAMVESPSFSCCEQCRSSWAALIFSMWLGCSKITLITTCL